MVTDTHRNDSQTDAHEQKRVPKGEITAAAELFTQLMEGTETSSHDGDIASVLHLLHALLWTIAKREPVDSVVLEIASVLDRINTRLAEQEAARTLVHDLENRLATAKRTTEHLATGRDAAVRAQVQSRAQIADLERALADERGARALAEHERRTQFTSAITQLRATAADAMAAMETLATLTERARGVHTAIDTTVHAVAAAALRGTPVDTEQRAALAGMKVAYDHWIGGLRDRIADAVQERTTMQEEIPALDARRRTDRMDTASTHRRAWIMARTAQLDAFIAECNARKQPVEAARADTDRRLAAMDALAVPGTTRAELPEIPTLPEPSTIDAVVAEPEPSRAPRDARTLAAGNDAKRPRATHAPDAEDISEEQLAVNADPEVRKRIRTAIVLYELIRVDRQRSGAPNRNFTIGRISNDAQDSGLLTARKWGRKDFVLALSARVAVDEKHQYLTWRGIVGAGVFGNSFVRTEHPIPTEWDTLITPEERTRFLVTFAAHKPKPPKGS